MSAPNGLSSAQSPPPGSSRSRRSHRSRRPRNALSTITPVGISSLQGSSPRSSPRSSSIPDTPPPPITPIEEEAEGSVGGAPSISRSANARNSAVAEGDGELSSEAGSSQTSRSPSRDVTRAGSELAIHVHPPPDSPMSPEPPTPDLRDIHLQALASSSSALATSGSHVAHSGQTALGGLAAPNHDPPAYSPLDAYAYSEGVHIDLPAEVIAAALERGTIPSSMLGTSSSSRSDRHRNRRDRR